MLVGRLLGGVSAMSSPPMMILPEVGVSSPEIMRKSVVFPQPDGPRSAKNSFWSMSKKTSSTALTPPGKVLVTLRSDTIGSAIVLTLARFLGRLKFHCDYGRDYRDDDQHRRCRIDFRRHAAADQRIDLDRESNGFRPRGEIGDHEIIERKRECKEGAGDETRHHEGY